MAATKTTQNIRCAATSMCFLVLLVVQVAIMAGMAWSYEDGTEEESYYNVLLEKDCDKLMWKTEDERCEIDFCYPEEDEKCCPKENFK